MRKCKKLIVLNTIQKDWHINSLKSLADAKNCFKFVKVNDVKYLIDEYPFYSYQYIFHIIRIDTNTSKDILIEYLHMKRLYSHCVPIKNFKIRKFSETLSILI